MKPPSKLSRIGDGLGSDERTRPLCVSFEGCLIKVDPLTEGFFASLRKLENWCSVLPCLVHGKAQLQARLSAIAPLDASHVPCNARLLDYLRNERALGRRIVLVAEADRRLAEEVASHLGCFEAVIAPADGKWLRGATKLEAISAYLRGADFSYAGN